MNEVYACIPVLMHTDLQSYAIWCAMRCMDMFHPVTMRYSGLLM
jgi:hypothetical protein